MSQLFTPRADLILYTLLGGIVLGIAGVAVAGYAFIRSSYMTRVGLDRDQPVPFSHEHHVRGLGLDCRYCHISVEESAFASIPAASICMNCHTQIWADAPMLEPVRRSFAEKTPLKWTRVHDMPDFVYFDHSAHVNQGIGCVTCHGRVDEMPLMHKTRAMFMKWCLDCHRDPAPNLRPPEQVFAMSDDPPAGATGQGDQLMEHYGIEANKRMTDCVTCHR